MELLNRLGLDLDRFAGQVAVVTGGARGIGEQLARALAHLGAHAIILDKRNEGETVAMQIRGNTRSAEFKKVDLTDTAALQRVAQEILGAHGRVDLLVNNATKFELERFANFAIEEWEELHRTTVRASAFLISAFLPGMIENGSGVICNTMASEGMSYAGPFSAAMVGQRSMMLTLAGELGAEGNITVMGFAPGATDTPLFRDMAGKFGELHGMTLDEWANNILKNPGYEGFMPAEHVGASYAYCLAHAREYHGQIADAFGPLIRHGIIDPHRDEEEARELDGAYPFSPIDDVNEFLKKMTSMNRNLERRIEERTKELATANERLAGQKQLLEDMASKISRYLPRQVYESIFSGEINTNIASRRRFLTILFCDIADFTARSERLEPEALTTILNSYFAAMTEVARIYGATVDKFIGDAVLVFFGDPDTEGPERDAERCISMAIEMQRRIGSLAARHVRHGLHKPLKIRIGINSGYCTVGNFGSFDRIDYTIIGQPVNVAARLQDAGEPGQILVSRNTQALVADCFRFAPVGALRLKGIADEIEGYSVTFDELADSEPSLSPEDELLALKQQFDQININELAAADREELLRTLSKLLRT